MKKLCFAAFVAFWSSIATLLAVQAVATDHAQPPVPSGAHTSEPLDPRSQ